MRVLVLAIVSLLVAGCGLSKDESSLARLYDEAKNKKEMPPKDFPTEDQLGVHFYPGCSFAKHSESDEGGFHVVEAVLDTSDSTDKIRAFYEKELGAKAMPTTPPFYSIQRDYGGKHYEVGYGLEGTIDIKVSRATG